MRSKSHGTSDDVEQGQDGQSEGWQRESSGRGETVDGASSMSLGYERTAATSVGTTPAAEEG